MGASLDPFGSEGDPNVVKYSILSKMSDTKEFFVKQDPQKQICCILVRYF